MEWTKEQQKAINCRENKSILLSAAAGSGKTAVLVERIISRIKDSENPLSVNELLVLTFTEAAAAEMKRKIQSALRKALEKDPENEHLKKQLVLLHSASVSTVHSFCRKILKGHIHMTALPAEFALASEAEAELLLKEAVDLTLEKYYSRIGRLSSFRELCAACGSPKSDASLRESITGLYLFSKSLPYPYEWLKESVKTYKILAKEKDNKNTIWHRLKKAECEALTADLLSCCEAISDILSRLPEDHKYRAFYSAETDRISEAADSFRAGIISEINSFKFPSKVRKQNTYPAEEQAADSLRDLEKSIFASLKELAGSETPESEELYEKLYRRAKTLKNIIIAVDKKYARLKAEKGLLDFSDLEHGLLSLISDKNHNPTSAALELRSRFSEIFLDEYQDTNSIQEEIFRLVSRDGKNIFMVGDLKQSIYKFRNAVPELFAGKRRLYGENPDKGLLLKLSRNFRSRREVIDTVNFMFSGLMTEALGDIDYNTEEFLIQGAEFPAAESESAFETEYCVIISDSEESGDNSIDAVSLSEAEAYAVAGRIEEIIKSGFSVYDAKAEMTRKAEYRDIVILLRNRTCAPLMGDVLEERGIPVSSDTGKGYMSSPEVGIILSFLNIIDNPYQDIPLIAVLRSYIFGFTAEELAEIRTVRRDCWFYDALSAAAEDGFDKAKNFLKELCYLRKLSETESIYRLVLTIYERYNCLAAAGRMSSPELRRANLRLLAQRAADFEHTKKQGLFSFMNYLETLKNEKKDLAPAKLIAESENAVRIMTIHKSKGLEFPIVILADTSRKFNTDDTKGSISYCKKAGISLAAVDAEARIKYPSLSSSLFKSIQKRELLSEEMRLLYVALTRAKEKLIITSVLNRSASRLLSPVYGGDKKPLPAYLKGCHSFAEWISASFMTHPAAKELRELGGFEEDAVSTNAQFKLKVTVKEASKAYPVEAAHAAEDADSESPTAIEQAPQSDSEADFSEITSILSAAPPPMDKIPVKITVSELKRRLSDQSDYSPRLISPKNIYLKKKEELTAAEIGTITHFVLQHLNERDIHSASDLEQALDKAAAEGVISAAQKSAVNKGSILSFYESDLGKRLKASPKVRKEYSFYSHIKAGELYPEAEGETKEKEVLLQGTIDCFFTEENGRTVLLDYKTDSIQSEQAEQRAAQYKIQLDCYNKALEDIFGKKADESYIYFLSCAEAVRMD